MIEKNEIFDGVVGGEKLSDRNTRKDIFEPKDLKVESELDKKMARLLILHPELQVNFRNNDLASLDEKTKQALLADMYEIIGVTPTK